MIDRKQLTPAQLFDIEEGQVVYIINPYHPDFIVEHKISYKHITVNEIKETHPYVQPPDKYINAYIEELVQYIEEGKLFVKQKINGKEQHNRSGATQFRLQVGGK